MNSNSTHSHKWVGLLEVRQLPGKKVLGENRGAHVTAVGWATSEKQYIDLMRASLLKEGLEIIDAEDIESCDSRCKSFEVGPEFLAVLKNVNKDNTVEFMSFHTFPLDENGCFRHQE